MTTPHGSPQRVLICLVLGLLAIAAVPGIGWLSDQFYETIALCVGIALCCMPCSPIFLR